VIGTSVEHGKSLLIVEHEDGSGIAVIDPRPFPEGHVLPF